MEGINGDGQIAKYWRDYFKYILTSVNRYDTPNREILDFSNDMNVSKVVKAINC